MSYTTPDFFADQVSSPISDIQALETPEGELHLRFYIPSGEEFALPAIGIRETLFQSPERITPIPNVSPLLLGTLNVRGRVIWVADLGQFLGDTVPLSTDRPELHVIAIEDQDTMLGLVVDSVEGTDWLSQDAIQISRDTPDSMAPFVRGEWIVKDKKDGGEKRLRLLDQVAIVRAARWAM
jgi:purine-binding chemotaxis protein CheW